MSRHTPKANPWLRLLRWVLVLAIIGVIAILPYPHEVGGDATVTPNLRASARAKFSGEIIAVHVKEGDWVEPGQLLAAIDGWEQRHAVRISEAELERKKLELSVLEHGPKEEEIAQAREELRMAEVKAEHSRKQREVLGAGLEGGGVSEMQYARAVEEAAVDAAAVEVARTKLALVQSGALDMEIDVKQAEIRALEERLAQERTELERTQIYAPIAGTVVTPNVHQKLGDFLQEGELFAVIEDTRNARVEILIPEADILEVELDAPVKLRIWSNPNRPFGGKVDAIAPVVESDPNNMYVNVVRVASQVENAKGLLKSEVTGYAKIDCGERPVAFVFSRALTRFFLIEMWSWIP
jgi:multidrug resistance efflux pump